MTIVNKYQIYCNTEQTYKTVWSDSAINTCPANESHSVDNTSISIVNTVVDGEVKIKNENVPSGGNIRYFSIVFTALPNEITVHDFSVPYNINIKNGICMWEDVSKGDDISIQVAPDTIVGVITQNITSSDTILHFSPSAITNLFTGYYITLTDGTNTSDSLLVLDVDKINNTVTLHGNVGMDFNAATPTYVRMSVYLCKELTLGPQFSISMGSDIILTKFLPANTIMRFIYHNKHSEIIKVPTIYIQALY